MTREQRTEALKRANEQRFRAAAIKRELMDLAANKRTSLMLLASMLADPEYDFAALKVADALLACRGVGRRHMALLMKNVRLPDSVRVAELSADERIDLVWAIREHIAESRRMAAA